MNPGDIIKSRRLELDMTQEELGEKVGLKKSAIAKYESGRVENLKRSMIKKLSEALELTPNQIMGFKEVDELTDFTTLEDAMNFLLNQNVVMGSNGLDISDLNEEELIEYANEVIDMMRLISLKYKRGKNNGLDR